MNDNASCAIFEYLKKSYLFQLLQLSVLYKKPPNSILSRWMVSNVNPSSLVTTLMFAAQADKVKVNISIINPKYLITAP